MKPTTTKGHEPVDRRTHVERINDPLNRPVEKQKPADEPVSELGDKAPPKKKRRLWR